MKPILFNTNMIRAIMSGKKTVTRRIVKPQLGQDASIYITPFREAYVEWRGMPTDICYKLPYYPGDILYVRETWAEWTGGYVYKADDTLSSYPLSFVGRWRPSIHMPKEAARIFLRVTDVRVERLQQISEIEACSEGAIMIQMARELWSYRKGFENIWNSTVKPADLTRYGWAANPWVWVISFERCEKPDERSF